MFSCITSQFLDAHGRSWNWNGLDWLTGVTWPHLEVELCLREVLVQSGRQVLRRGQNDAADTNIMVVLPRLDTLMPAAAAAGCRVEVWCVLLAGEEPHHVPVAGENAELHQVSEDTQNLQQELLKVEMKRR